MNNASQTPLRSWQRFRAIWPAVATLLDQGYSIRAVHQAAIDEGVWTSGYEVFRRHVAKARKGGATDKQLNLPATGHLQPQRPAAPEWTMLEPAGGNRDHLARRMEKPAYRYTPSETTKHLY